MISESKAGRLVLRQSRVSDSESDWRHSAAAATESESRPGEALALAP